MKSKRILMIGFESKKNHFLLGQLRLHRFEIRMVDNGLEGFYMARSEVPDIIILNHHLPDIPGTMICRLLKSNKNLHNTPVILYASRLRDNDNEVVSQCGANAYIINDIGSMILAVLGLLRDQSASRESGKAGIKMYTYLDQHMSAEQCLDENFEMSTV